MRLARDTAKVWFRNARRKPDASGPQFGQQKPFAGEQWTQHDEKAAHMFPERIMSMNRDTGPRHGPPWSHWAPFWVVLGPGHLGRNCPLWAHGGALRGGNVQLGAKGDPSDAVFRSHYHFRGERTPNWKFHSLLKILVLFATANCGPVRSGSVSSHSGLRRRIAGGKRAFWGERGTQRPETHAGSADPQREISFPQIFWC